MLRNVFLSEVLLFLSQLYDLKIVESQFSYIRYNIRMENMTTFQNNIVDRKGVHTDVSRLTNSSWSLKLGYHPHLPIIINTHSSFARTTCKSPITIVVK